MNWLRVALLFALVSTTGVQAGTVGWSFAAHSHPGPADMTYRELAAINATEAGPGGLAAYCWRMLRTEFAIYNDRYPDFAESSDRNSRYSSWKKHVITVNRPTTEFCIFVGLYFKLSKVTTKMQESGLIFCGRYSREPKTSWEQNFVALMSELVDYIHLASPDAMNELLRTQAFLPPISLNADVEYFLRKSVEQSGEFAARWKSGELEPLLDGARIAFLDKAVAEHDFEAVLDSTSPCTKP